MSDAQEQNRRFLQAVSYLIEWAKHIMTLAAALMVLSVTFLKDLAKDTRPPLSYILLGALVAFYALMLTAVWFALRLVRHAASHVLTNDEFLGTGDALHDLKSLLERTQRVFLGSLMFFALLAVCVLGAWAFR